MRPAQTFWTWLRGLALGVIVSLFAVSPARALAQGTQPLPSQSASQSAAQAQSAQTQDAPQTVVTPPRDVPLVVQPYAVKVPPVPATYQQKDMGWLRVSYIPAAHERLQPLLKEAEDVKAQLADALGQPVLDHVDVRIARTYDEMVTLAPSEISLPPNASGIALPALDLVLLILIEPRSMEATDLGEVFRHELSHIALSDAVKMQHVPRWFDEGLALYLSGEHPWKRRQTLGNAALTHTLLPLSELDRGFPDDNYDQSVAYAEAGDFVRFLLRDGDRARFASLVERTRGGQPFERALADAYGTDLRKLEYQWREEVAKHYTFLPVLTGGSFVWVLVIGAMVYGYVRKKRRDKVTLARWEREDAVAAEEAARRAEKATALDLADAAQMQNVASLPKIEHEGGWHTLH